MTEQRPPSWRAPVCFRTHRGAVRWAVERNPYRPGSEAFVEWLQRYWRDQRDRGLVRADRSAKVAIVFASIALVISILRLLGVLA